MATQPTAIKSGVLYKKSEVVKIWNERWAAVHPGELVYWKTKDDFLKGKPARGRIALSPSAEVVSQGSDALVSRYMFELRGQSISAQFASGWE